MMAKGGWLKMAITAKFVLAFVATIAGGIEGPGDDVGTAWQVWPLTQFYFVCFLYKIIDLLWKQFNSH